MAEYKVNYTQSNFTGGIIATELYGRNDFNKVKTGLKTCTNWTIREAGGLEFRRGTKYVQTVPSDIGGDFVMSTISNTLLFFTRSGIKYIDNSGTWQTVSYPSDVHPVVEKLQFTEIRQRLYYYDGVNKLAAVYVTYSTQGNPTVTTKVEKFESVPSDVTVVIEHEGDAPQVTVQVPYTYAISLAKDEDHESLPIYLTQFLLTLS